MLKKFLLLSFLLTGIVWAEETPKPFTFTTHTIASGPITVCVLPLDLVTEQNVPVEVTYVLKNASDAAISCDVKTWSIETVKTQGGETTVEVPAKGEVTQKFQVVAGEGTFSAHYPIYVSASFTADDKAMKAEAVRVMETRFASLKKAFEPTVVKVGGVSLLNKSYVASYQFAGEPEVILGENWEGSIPNAHGGCNMGTQNAGESRTAIVAHPPYVPKGGDLFLKYPVVLPESEKITLSYGCAIRQQSAQEPSSDGVTFRFFAKEAGKDAVLLDEIHTDSKTWVDRVADLSAFAGKAVDVIVVFNPGPKNNTTCDGCFLSGLVLNTVASVTLAPSENVSLPTQRYEMALNEGYKAWICPGTNGLLDAKIEIGKPGDEASKVSFQGVNLAIGNQPLLNSSVPFTKKPTLRWDSEKQRLVFETEVLNDDEKQPVTLYAYAQNGILVLEIPEGNPEKIGGFSLREADKKVTRVYYGHGFVIENPKENFVVGHGGHDLATSHVGLDFENGTSLVMGSPDCPLRFLVDSENQRYTLENSGVCRLEVVPSAGGAYAAAKAYRENSPWHAKPSKGTVRKRGRLVFDVWGGTYVSDAKEVEQCLKYGVNDAMFLKHVWQYWGYDVRLPDIWNTNDPNLVLKSLGKYEELKAFAELCRENGIPFGLHDNYIDFYPDAEKFSYDYTTFHANGTPRRAWVNHGAQVLSYQWRPDLFQPFLLRNMELGRKYLPTMDAYFVDVFSSMRPFDFYDRDGKFHPKSETTKRWKECFEIIGRELAHGDETAITVSEAGADYLMESLDGADCQWMLIDSKRGGPWRKYVPCETWARTPWFAAVNHTNFSRHGAGYADRYNAKRNFALHNVMSDDYISAEILGGLDLMVVKGCVFPGAVRKHYLAQHVVRQLADKEIDRVEFADENVRRQCVTWSDGTQVYVNRGEGNWTIRDYTLPKYGFVVFDKEGKVMSGIVRNPKNVKEIVEFSKRKDDSFYLFGRGVGNGNILPVQPLLNHVEVLEGGKKFKTVVDWNVMGEIPKNLTVFVHVFEPQQGYGFKPTGWYAGGEPVPAEPGSGFTTGGSQILTVPDDLRDGTYHVMVGFFDKNRRYPLMGEDAQEMRYSVASLTIRGGKIVGEVKAVELTETPEDFARLAANQTPFTLGGVSTLGAVSVKPGKGTLEILPLPMMPEFDVTIDENVFPVTSVTCDGKDVAFTRDGKNVTFHVQAADAKVYVVKVF